MRQLAFHANLFQIHGGGLSRGALLNFMDVSGIEALPSTRLYEMWFEQKWGTKLALRAGNRYVGNLAPMPGVFPDYPAPVIRNAGDEREMVLMRWGMPRHRSSEGCRSRTFAICRHRTGAAG
jgi:hypothetical protein